MPKTKRTVHTKEVVSSLCEADLKLLLSYKDGGFVVMPSGSSAEKAKQAIVENFRIVPGVIPEKVRKEGLKRCEGRCVRQEEPPR